MSIIMDIFRLLLGCSSMTLSAPAYMYKIKNEADSHPQGIPLITST